MISKILFGILIAGGAMGYVYYNQTQVELIELRELVASYELKFETQDNTIKVMEERHIQQSNAMLEMSEKNKEIIAERDRYLDIFKRHDLSKLAAAKPGLIEPRVNNATKDVFDSLENDSNYDFTPGNP
tara:strand:+ start:754 stop:1140 length:387 start_codon:yes stop_codon:yes gene_type:complete